MEFQTPPDLGLDPRSSSASTKLLDLKLFKASGPWFLGV